MLILKTIIISRERNISHANLSYNIFQNNNIIIIPQLYKFKEIWSLVQEVQISSEMHANVNKNHKVSPCSLTQLQYQLS